MRLSVCSTLCGYENTSPEKDYEALYGQCDEIAKMLSGILNK